MERVRGIGPPSQPWEGRVLPLNHTRLIVFYRDPNESRLASQAYQCIVCARSRSSRKGLTSVRFPPYDKQMSQVKPPMSSWASVVAALAVANLVMGGLLGGGLIGWLLGHLWPILNPWALLGGLLIGLVGGSIAALRASRKEE